MINEKYDLKGSWVKRNSTPPQIGQRVTCTHCNQKYIFLGKKKQKQKSYRMLKLPRSTNNLGVDEKKGEEENDRCPMQVLGHHEPNVILKDNDLKHKIRLPGVTAKFLLQQLEKDSELLCSFGVMDYSLLGMKSRTLIIWRLSIYFYVVGVHNTEYIVDDPSICAPDSPFSSMTSDVKSLSKNSVRKVDADGHNLSSDPNPRRSSILPPRNGRLQVTPLFSQSNLIRWVGLWVLMPTTWVLLTSNNNITWRKRSLLLWSIYDSLLSRALVVAGTNSEGLLQGWACWGVVLYGTCWLQIKISPANGRTIRTGGYFIGLPVTNIIAASFRWMKSCKSRVEAAPRWHARGGITYMTMMTISVTSLIHMNTFILFRSIAQLPYDNHSTLFLRWVFGGRRWLVIIYSFSHEGRCLIKLRCHFF